MAIQTKPDLISNIVATLLDNNTQEISPSDLRTVVTDITDTLVALVTINKLSFGDEAATIDKDIVVSIGGLNDPTIRYNVTTSKWQFSNNGITFQDFGSGSGGISGLEENELLFGSALGEIEQDSNLSWISSTMKLLLGTDTEFDASAALKILHTATDYIKVEGKATGEEGRVGVRSISASDSAQIGAYPESGTGESYLSIINMLGAANKINVKFDTALVEIKGSGALDDQILSIKDQADNPICYINNRGEIKGYVSSSPPTASVTDSASLFVTDSKTAGTPVDGDASWFLRTEDGSLIDLRQADIEVITQNFEYPFGDSRVFPFKGNSSVFEIVSDQIDTTQIASVSYFVRRPILGVPTGMNYQSATSLSDVNLWIAGSNTIGGVAYTSPSNFDYIEILAQVVFASGWESSAGFSFVVKRKSL